ncbi:MAG: nitronate monooxygenase [Candidatus Acidiferrales bacterium]
MFPATRFTKLLGVEYPILLAPMAGASTAELTAAVSRGGGLGAFAAAVLSPDAIHAGIARVRELTDKPFSVNLFILESTNPEPQQVARALELLAPIRKELGLPPGEPLAKYSEDNRAQFDAVLAERPALASFTFGILTKAQVEEFHSRGILVMGTATTVAEAKAWEVVGADLICAQGSDAGAHRGTFLGDFEESLVGTMSLVPQMADAVRVPVIAAGGIMDGRGIAASLMLGAAGAQMGTAFLSCPESGIPEAWRNALMNARDDQTRVSRIYSGRYARGIVNEFMRKLTPVAAEIPPYPIQNALTGPIRRAAGQANRPEYLSLWAGQAASMSRGLPAEELFAALVRETSAVLQMASGGAITSASTSASTSAASSTSG